MQNAKIAFQANTMPASKKKKIETGQKFTAKESFAPLSDCYFEKQIHLPELTFSLSLPPRQSWITNHNKQ